ncbi:MAG: hypothetical protein DRP57_02690 [Spirochaetes bacterium]|nr:MAG: hypothetical protein DRP57_02690 [Spirochaetota bacterium]
MGETVVVIGGNAAGMSAASQAKRKNKDLNVVVLEKSPFISYGECGLPYYIGGVIKESRKLFVLSLEDARNKRGIDVRINHEVVKIDTKKKMLEVLNREKGGNGEGYSLIYDRLVIATGAKSVRLKLPGSELENIFHLKFFEDAEKIKEFISLQKPRKAVIVGAGYIGLEMTENLKELGIDVTVVEMLPTVMGDTENDIHSVILEELEKRGVKVLLETSVKGFSGKGGKVTKVLTDKGDLDADFVIESVGIVPETSLAESAGIETGSRRGIAIDKYMRTNVENIFAAGDCAEIRHIVSGQPVFIPLALNANRGGRYAGGNAALSSEEAADEKNLTAFPGTLGSAVAKIFSVEVGKVGLSLKAAAASGFDAVTATVRARTKAGYWPDHPPVTITLIAERKTRKLLGAQLAGGGGSALRIDTIAVSIAAGMTVDTVGELDLAYAPPFAPSWDPVLIAANVLAKKL